MEFYELRKMSGMSCSQFAAFFGIPYRTVQSWEKGERKPPEYLLRLLHYKLSKDELLK
jgi:DNA-binding transcriptional regulator YiaG